MVHKLAIPCFRLHKKPLCDNPVLLEIILSCHTSVFVVRRKKPSPPVLQAHMPDILIRYLFQVFCRLFLLVTVRFERQQYKVAIWFVLIQLERVCLRKQTQEMTNPGKNAWEWNQSLPGHVHHKFPFSGSCQPVFFSFPDVGTNLPFFFSTLLISSQ